MNEALAHTSLSHFIRQNWRSVVPNPYTHGWQVEAICDHLEAVSRGEIKRLIINVPPRHMKSLAVSVHWPMWDWLHTPERRWMFASYAQTLSMRDSTKSRRVFQSDRYQELLSRYQPGLDLMDDQNTKIRFENNLNGQRLATSVGGTLTGEGGDIIVVDDPHNVREGESETKRIEATQWWDESMSTRLNNPSDGAFVIIMQRIHEEDLTGHILEREMKDWDHLVLPARYEGKRQLYKVKSSIGFKDPRKREGQLLWPERVDEDTLSKLELTLREYGTAGQLQQRPAPRGGGMYKVGELRFLPLFDRRQIKKSVRYWDKAGTEGGGARTAGVFMHVMSSGQIVIEDVVKGQWSAMSREKRIKQVADMDEDLNYKINKVNTWVEQEPGSGGKESAENTIRNLAGHNIRAERVTGSKVDRADPFAAQVEAGNVWLVKGPRNDPNEWVNDFIKELETFPNGKFKDQADAAAGAFNKLFEKSGKKKVGAW